MLYSVNGRIWMLIYIWYDEYTEGTVPFVEGVVLK